jgi:hypothetical protein
MRIDSMTKSYVVRAVLVMSLLLSISGRAIAVRDDSQQLTQVLGEARDEAAELARDADEMESLIRNEVSWQTHAVMLDRVKDHVNNMARIVAKLSDTRASGSDLQEQAVDRILPFLFPLTVYAAIDENPQLTQLLADANDEAFELARDATNTQMLIRTDENWVDHALMLTKVKGHVDNLALIIEKLNKAQNSGSELQKQAVEQMLPLVKQLSANTTAAINYLKQSKTRPVSDTYTRYLEKNAETAHQLSSIISSLIDYEKSMTEIEKLRSKLEAPGN